MATGWQKRRAVPSPSARHDAAFRPSVRKECDCSLDVLGLLHLLYSCVDMLFWRVFMRISYTCPEHLKFALTVEKWTELVQLTGSAIDWLDANEKMYDVWLLVAYCATSCALVQVRPLVPGCISHGLNDRLTSTTPSRAGKMRRPEASYGNCVTAFAAGRHRYRRTTCPHDERLVPFLIFCVFCARPCC